METALPPVHTVTDLPPDIAGGGLLLTQSGSRHAGFAAVHGARWAIILNFHQGGSRE